MYVSLFFFHSPCIEVFNTSWVVGQEITQDGWRKNRCGRGKLSPVPRNPEGLAGGLLEASAESSLVMPSRDLLLFAQRGGMLLSFILPASGPFHVSSGYQMSPVAIVSERLRVLKLHSFGLELVPAQRELVRDGCASSVQVQVVIHRSCVTLNIPHFWTAALKSDFQLCPSLSDLTGIWDGFGQLCR